MVPTAIRTKTSDILEINEDESYQNKMRQINSKIMLDIIEFIEDNGGSTSTTVLTNYFVGTRLDVHIKKLLDMNLITKRHILKNKMNEKVEKTFYINEHIDIPGSRAKRQAAVYEIIKQNPGITHKQLKEIDENCTTVIRQLLEKYMKSAGIS
jgi:hypothetical protein